MSSPSNMLRTRRKDNNVKPNRRDTIQNRLDRKSSRGMLYENEELRLRTININAEIERGHNDIKKLKRENELLKKEIWCLRDEYDKLDKLLKEKIYDIMDDSSTSDSDSNHHNQHHHHQTENDEDDDEDEVDDDDNEETSQNRANLKNLHDDFDHLSIVPEENESQWNYELKPDQSYPIYENLTTNQTPVVNFFAPLPPPPSSSSQPPSTNPDEEQQYSNAIFLPTLNKSMTDLLVKSDNRQFDMEQSGQDCGDSSTCPNGNIDELLDDIATISNDILEITKQPNDMKKPYKSELNVVLMPTHNDENVENLQFATSSMAAPPSTTPITTAPSLPSQKLSMRRKVAIHFRGSKTTPTSDVSSGDGAAIVTPTTPTPKHVHVETPDGAKTRHKHGRKMRNRRNTLESLLGERSQSIGSSTNYDDFQSERTNSVSSCETIKTRKMSNVSNMASGKVPWCACWGNGCV